MLPRDLKEIIGGQQVSENVEDPWTSGLLYVIDV